MGFRQWLKDRQEKKKKESIPPSTDRMDQALAFLDRATEEQRAHNEERRKALSDLKKEIEEDEKQALSLMRKIERSSEA